MSEAFQAEIAFLGMQFSPSFVRAPEGNGVAERFIHTLKEQLLWVQTFRTVAELNAALQAWLITYNESWLIERHGYRTPAQVLRLACHPGGRMIKLNPVSNQPRAEEPVPARAA